MHPNIKNLIESTIYGNTLTAILRIFMGILFIYSAFFKVQDLEAFGRVIIKYNVMPEIFTPYAAIIFPFIELITGIFLLIGYNIRASSLISIFLMIFFITIISINVIRGESFDCGCFELGRLGIKEKIGIPIIIRDVIFLLILILTFNSKKQYLSIDRIIEKEDLSHL